MSQEINLIYALCTIEVHKDNRQAQLDQMSYEEYLQTLEWLEIRAVKLEEAGYTCENCRLPAPWLECHHLEYPQRGTETNKHLLACCQPCHRAIHKIKD